MSSRCSGKFICEYLCCSWLSLDCCAEGSFSRYIFFEPKPSLKIPNHREAQENLMCLHHFVKISLEEAKGGVSFSIIII